MNLIDNYKSQITELCDNEIDAFFTYREKRFDDYSKDIILKRAIERNLEIIGEAIGRILKEEPDFSIQNARFFRDFFYIAS